MVNYGRVEYVFDYNGPGPQGAMASHHMLRV